MKSVSKSDDLQLIKVCPAEKDFTDPRFHGGAMVTTKQRCILHAHVIVHQQLGVEGMVWG